MSTQAAESGLKRAIADSLKAYAAGDAKFFDFLHDDVRVFNLDQDAEPLIGRKKFESAFRAGFKKKREVDVLFEDIQASGQQAVLTQTLSVTAEGVTQFVRQTVIWEHGRNKKWQISHIHNARVGQPVISGKLDIGAKAVRVVNERIATAAAAVGVAQ